MLSAVGRNLLVQAVSPLVSLADRLLVFGLLIRAWGTETYADYAVALSLAGTLSLAEGGLNIYFGNLWQTFFAAGDEAAFRRTARVASFVALVLGLSLVVVAAALIAILPPPRAVDGDTMRMTFLLLAASSIARVTRGSLSQIYRGRGAFARGELMSQVQAILSVAAIGMAALAGAKPVAIAALDCGCEIVFGWALVLTDLHRRYRLSFLPTVPACAELQDLARRLPPFTVQQGAPGLLLQMPVLAMSVCGVLATPLVGFINLRTLVNTGRMPVTMLSIASGVELALTHRRAATRALEPSLLAAARVSGATVACVAAAILIFGKAIVTLWTARPDLYDQSVAAFLLGGALAAAPGAPLASFLAYVDRARPVALALLVQLGIAAAGLACLTPFFAARGAACALAVAEIVAMGLALPILARDALAFSPLALFAKTYAAAALAGLWCAMCGTLIASLVPPTDLPALLADAAAYALFAAAPAVAFSAPRQMRRDAWNALIRIRPAR